MNTAVKSFVRTAWDKVEALFAHIDHIPRGFSAAGVHAGLKTWPRKDVALFKSEVPAIAAATFTTNNCPGAPVQVSREIMAQHAGNLQVVAVNSAGANSATGLEGVEAARRMSLRAAKATNTDVPAFVMSTGIIGIPLPIDSVCAGIDKASEALGTSESSFFDAAHAILLEDTKPKVRSTQFLLPSTAEVGGQPSTTTGRILVFGKGAGMIHPGMATVLVVGMTDVAISRECLSDAWRECIQNTINHVDIDGDMSTNDTAVILANGLAGNKRIDSKDTEDYKVFKQHLFTVLSQIAKGLVRDGGGATKFVTIIVRGAKNDEQALIAARRISTSEQVKAPLSGGKGNWGAIVMAVGAANVEVHPDRMSLWMHKGSEEDELSDTTVFLKDGHLEPEVPDREKDILSQNDLTFEVDLGCQPEPGQSGEAHVWTTDLTVQYIVENS